MVVRGQLFQNVICRSLIVEWLQSQLLSQFKMLPSLHPEDYNKTLAFPNATEYSSSWNMLLIIHLFWIQFQSDNGRRYRSPARDAQESALAEA